ncbi:MULTISPECIES: formyltransferase family protein [unclassified Pseudomonas]|uniref:formyltransferase family protein n=1 Tax=unclassified Pseudomonas TaxID=196821 RepID=UPI000BC5BD37|nr:MULTISPECIES: formyltransferase family protein [unclassified Pseudomonas]PVZ16461.1 methionyl-tRNA formyltransferase [Pseudomonas sp. URIL14HWK12:I12]PVZ25683.1 methionyl-tRNA formyltransferase [Pseudomonas sp. URIL14HWK12:I10]PVZ36793.1 methionyl-tRNA formyltransferase [Pseudomonas sp. URIL14HWK12:I11]SNZ12602.1 Ankyrin repeat-containing protein [Pseudomonas sp. URIL14HWK12:I9]
MIVIAGKNNIAVHALNTLARLPGTQALAVVCNVTDDGQDGWQRSLKRHAETLGIPVITLAQAYDQATLFLSLEFDKIVRPERFRQARCYNIHFSLLPRYKGMYTAIWPVLNGDREAGVSLHVIDAGIDTGELIAQRTFKLTEWHSAKDLYLKCIEASCLLFDEQVQALVEGAVSPYPQAAEQSTYYSRQSIDFSRLKVDLVQTAWQVSRQVRAYAFRNYQLPSVEGERFVNCRITNTRSSHKAGSLVLDTGAYAEYATIDYNIRLFRDRQSEVFAAAQTRELADVPETLLGLCSVDDRNAIGWTLLMIACYNGFERTARALLEAGADINASNAKGTTVLMYAKDHALKVRDSTFFRWLVGQGADIERRDLTGRRLADYVSAQDYDFLLG